MAEFSVPEARAVVPGEEIVLPEIQMGPGSKFWVEYKWMRIKDGAEGSGHWEIKNDSLEGAYTTWRKENWERLFDPLKIKILGLTITRTQ